MDSENRLLKMITESTLCCFKDYELVYITKSLSLRQLYVLSVTKSLEVLTVGGGIKFTGSSFLGPWIK